MKKDQKRNRTTNEVKDPEPPEHTGQRGPWLTEPLRDLFDESAQRRVLNAVSLIAAGFLALEFAYIMISGQEVGRVMSFVFWFGFLSFLGAPLVVRFTQSTASGALVVLIALAGLIVVPAYYQGGASALFTIWFLLVPLLAGLILGHRVAILMGIIGVAVMTGLVGLELTGKLPVPTGPMDPLPAWLNLVAVIGFSAVLGAISAKTFVASSERLRQARAADAAKAGALEEAIEGIARVGADGRLKTINSAFATLHAAKAETLIGSQADEWILDEDREEVARGLRALTQSGRYELTIRGCRENGTAFYANMFLIAIPDGDSGEHYRFARDVTQQRELTEQLSQSVKMDAIGRLAGGIAHDFNNLLQTIISASDRVKREISQSPNAEAAAESLSWIDTAAQRGASLTRQLLDFSHVQAADSGPIDIHESIQRLVEILNSVLGASIHTRVVFCDFQPSTVGDLARFESGLMNLAVNARDAMPHGGILEFRTSIVRMDPGSARFAAFNLETDQFVCIQVIDNGEGMETSLLENIFDPFFTTKPVGKGTGLGLSLFYSYAREVGGALEVESTTNEGTTVTVYLPLCDVSKVASAAPTKRAPTGNETILLAEDEPVVTQLLSGVLSAAGFKVIACVDGDEAIEQYQKHRDSIRLALLDYRMPHKNGIEVFDAVRKITPDLPVVLMSGNIASAEKQELQKNGLRAVLRKPCSGQEILQAIRNALDTEPPAPNNE